ncbi:efflux RND transporter periplasmic adaptor subunit [Neolewinella lacunae]|uniref:Efflux RND transporter periplasmic adaptor subunit n=1 Tax=Neolewinella lacunae TaxID=1517758 RepID=A0A923PS70_9BACT|nr:efflux RND transporter periplasmic adaptor subunit [Neolewinella lacunae]MBC6996766.1 efflux RND transporter periplasmic adaptor subunit [Neolewinella lacunae]MDN3633886.1 efflux RND transporter periplasmic adaptor subunit [Neolewinella lacunae]
MKVLFSLFLLALCVACGTSPEPPAEAAATAAEPTPGLVQTGPLPERQISHEIACTGTVEVPPTDLISVHARTPGQVSDLRVLPGDYVRKGTQLLRITNPELIPRQRLLLETRVQLAAARRTLERQNTLNAGEATTAAALDDAKSQVELLNATYTGLRQELLQYGVDVDGLEKDGSFQSSVGVFAGSSGYVHAVQTNQGKRVLPDDELIVLAGTDHLHLELSVPSREVAALAKGQRVTFRLPFNGAEGEASIKQLNPMVDMETATLNVHCHFVGELPDGIVPGLFLNATILTGERTLTGLPLSAVTREGEQYFGYRKSGDGLTKTLLADARLWDDFVAFTPPVPAGEWVTAGAYYLEE